jgi:hypothetical protein
MSTSQKNKTRDRERRINLIIEIFLIAIEVRAEEEIHIKFGIHFRTAHSVISDKGSEENTTASE